MCFPFWRGICLRASAILAITLLSLLAPAGTEGQDVEMLNR